MMRIASPSTTWALAHSNPNSQSPYVSSYLHSHIIPHYLYIHLGPRFHQHILTISCSLHAKTRQSLADGVGPTSSLSFIFSRPTFLSYPSLVSIINRVLLFFYLHIQ